MPTQAELLAGAPQPTMTQQQANIVASRSALSTAIASAVSAMNAPQFNISQQQARAEGLAGLPQRYATQQARREVGAYKGALEQQQQQYELEVARYEPEVAKPEYRQQVYEETRGTIQQDISKLQNEARGYEEEAQNYTKLARQEQNLDASRRLDTSAERAKDKADKINAKLSVLLGSLTKDPNVLIREYYSGQLGGEAEYQSARIQADIEAREQAREQQQSYEAKIKSGEIKEIGGISAEALNILAKAGRLYSPETGKGYIVKNVFDVESGKIITPSQYNKMIYDKEKEKQSIDESKMVSKLPSIPEAPSLGKYKGGNYFTSGINLGTPSILPSTTYNVTLPYQTRGTSFYKEEFGKPGKYYVPTTTLFEQPPIIKETKLPELSRTGRLSFYDYYKIGWTSLPFAKGVESGIRDEDLVRKLEQSRATLDQFSPKVIPSIGVKVDVLSSIFGKAKEGPTTWKEVAELLKEQKRRDSIKEDVNQYISKLSNKLNYITSDETKLKLYEKAKEDLSKYGAFDDEGNFRYKTSLGGGQRQVLTEAYLPTLEKGATKTDNTMAFLRTTASSWIKTLTEAELVSLGIVKLVKSASPFFSGTASRITSGFDRGITSTLTSIESKSIPGISKLAAYTELKTVPKAYNFFRGAYTTSKLGVAPTLLGLQTYSAAYRVLKEPEETRIQRAAIVGGETLGFLPYIYDIGKLAVKSVKTPPELTTLKAKDQIKYLQSRGLSKSQSEYYVTQYENIIKKGGVAPSKYYELSVKVGQNIEKQSKFGLTPFSNKIAFGISTQPTSTEVIKKGNQLFPQVRARPIEYTLLESKTKLPLVITGKPSETNIVITQRKEQLPFSQYYNLKRQEYLASKLGKDLGKDALEPLLIDRTQMSTMPGIVNPKPISKTKINQFVNEIYKSGTLNKAMESLGITKKADKLLFIKQVYTGESLYINPNYPMAGLLPPMEGTQRIVYRTGFRTIAEGISTKPTKPAIWLGDITGTYIKSPFTGREIEKKIEVSAPFVAKDIGGKQIVEFQTIKPSRGIWGPIESKYIIMGAEKQIPGTTKDIIRYSKILPEDKQKLFKSYFERPITIKKSGKTFQFEFRYEPDIIPKTSAEQYLSGEKPFDISIPLKEQAKPKKFDRYYLQSATTIKKEPQIFVSKVRLSKDTDLRKSQLDLAYYFEPIKGKPTVPKIRTVFESLKPSKVPEALEIQYETVDTSLYPKFKKARELIYPIISKSKKTNFYIILGKSEEKPLDPFSLKDIGKKYTGPTKIDLDSRTLFGQKEMKTIAEQNIIKEQLMEQPKQLTSYQYPIIKETPKISYGNVRPIKQELIKTETIDMIKPISKTESLVNMGIGSISTVDLEETSINNLQLETPIKERIQEKIFEIPVQERMLESENIIISQEKILQVPAQKRVLEFENISEIQQGMIQTQTPIQQFIQKNIQKQVQKQIQRPSPIVIPVPKVTPRPSTEKIPEPKIPIVPPIFDLSKRRYPTKFVITKKKKQAKTGYAVEIRRKGKYERIALPFSLSKEEAELYGIKKSLGEAAATTRIVPSEKPLARLGLKVSPGIRGLFYKKATGEIVQKRLSRIITPGEKEEITYKGLSVIQKKPRASFIIPRSNNFTSKNKKQRGKKQKWI